MHSLLREEEPNIRPMQGLPDKNWRLRWRFDFYTKPTVIGVWDNGSDHVSNQAQYVSKVGLAKAWIERERVGGVNSKVEPVVEIPGCEYVSFQWEGFVIPPMKGMVAIAARIRPLVLGLTVITLTHRITAYVDGRIEAKALTPEELKTAKELDEYRL